MNNPNPSTDSEAGELKACPFCGGEPKFSATYVDNPSWGWIGCRQCGASSEPDSRKSATEAWNDRAPLPAPSTVTDAMIEAAARHIVNEEATNCKTLDAALCHRENWRRAIPEAKAILEAAMQSACTPDTIGIPIDGLDMVERATEAIYDMTAKLGLCVTTAESLELARAALTAIAIPSADISERRDEFLREVYAHAFNEGAESTIQQWEAEQSSGSYDRLNTGSPTMPHHDCLNEGLYQFVEDWRDKLTTLAAIPSVVRERDEWQPIETAPKDEWVLVYMPDEGSMGCIHAGSNRKISNGHLWFIGHHFASDLTPATHWRHLPKAPDPSQ